jgi:hypothetical protein
MCRCQHESLSRETSFDVLTSIKADPAHSKFLHEQESLQVILCLLTMAVIPFGIVAARLIGDNGILRSPRFRFSVANSRIEKTKLSDTSK